MKKALFALTLFASVGFFNPMQMVSPQMEKLIYYLCIFLSALSILIYGTQQRRINYPRLPYWLFIFMIAVSTVSASAFHIQAYSTSLMTTLPYFLSYLYFWIMLKMELPKEYVIKCIFVACTLAIPVYFINFISFPDVVFGEELAGDISRGILRVPLVFYDLFVMVLFYAINRILDNQGQKSKWITIASVCMVMIFLTVIRQVILYSVVLSLLFLLKKLSLSKKIAAVILGVITVVYILPAIPAYKTMIELSQDQIERNEENENVRLGAWRYYTFEAQTNSITPFTGNGIPSFGNSVWGDVFEDEIMDFHYYYADVAWAGIIFLFGWTGFAALLMLILKAIFHKKKPSQEYLTYWFIFVFLSGIGTGIFIYHFTILYIMIGLYLIYGPDKKNSNNNTELQQSI